MPSMIMTQSFLKNSLILVSTKLRYSVGNVVLLPTRGRFRLILNLCRRFERPYVAFALLLLLLMVLPAASCASVSMLSLSPKGSCRISYGFSSYVWLTCGILCCLFR